MKGYYTILLALCLILSNASFAQHRTPPSRPKLPSWMPQPPERPVRVHRNLIRVPMPNVLTANVPTYMYIAGFPGINIGAEYERFVTRNGLFSTALAINYLWAGTPEAGRMYYGEVRENIRVAYLAPGLFYHPAGNTDAVDISLGPVIHAGRLRQQRTVGGSSYPEAQMPVFSPYAALLGQVNMCVHSPGHFVFATTVAAGAMLPATETKGAVVQVGLQFGGRF